MLNNNNTNKMSYLLYFNKKQMIIYYIMIYHISYTYIYIAFKPQMIISYLNYI